MGVLKKVPEMPLSAGAAAGAKILLRFSLVRGLGQQPPGDKSNIINKYLVVPVLGHFVTIYLVRENVKFLDKRLKELKSGPYNS